MNSIGREGSHSLSLGEAISSGDRDLALRLAEQGACYDPAEMHGDKPLGHMPLLLAVREGDDALALALFLSQPNKKAAAEWACSSEDPCRSEVRHNSALIRAIDSGCARVVAAMAPHVDFGLAYELREDPLQGEVTLGALALITAARHRSVELIQTLSQAGAGERLGKLGEGALLSWAFEDKWGASPEKKCSRSLVDALLAVDGRPPAASVKLWILTQAIAGKCEMDVIDKLVEVGGAEAMGAWLSQSPQVNPLYLAADMGRSDAIESILKALPEAEARALCSKIAYGWETVLLRAAKTCSELPEELIRLSALRHPSGLPMSDAEENTPLHCSINSPTPDNALALIRHGCSVEANANGDTPLMLLASKGRLDPRWQAVALNWAASQPAIKNKSGESAVAMAIESGNAELALALIGAVPEEDMPWLWRKIIRAGSKEKRASTAAPGVDEKGIAQKKSLAARILALRPPGAEISGSLVRMAVRKGDEDFVLAAIKQAANREVFCEPSPDERSTPLMLAATHGSPKMIKALAALGAVRAKDKKGRTALMIAAQNGRLKCCEALISHSDSSAVDHSGRTALSWAASTKNAKLIDFLASNCDTGVVNQIEPITGHTPLTRAAKKGNAAAVEALLRRQASPLSGKYHLFSAALNWAADAGCARTVRALLPLCDPKRSSIMGRTPLLAAAMSKTLGSAENREIISLLMPLSDLEHKDCFGDGILDDLATNMSQPSEHDTASMLDFYNERALAIKEAREIAGGIPAAREEGAPRRL